MESIPSPNIEVFNDLYFSYRVEYRKVHFAHQKGLHLCIASCTENDALLVEQNFNNFDKLDLQRYFFKKDDLIGIGKSSDVTQLPLSRLIPPDLLVNKTIKYIKDPKAKTKAYSCHRFPTVIHYTVEAVINCMLEALKYPQYIVVYSKIIENED